MVQNSTIGSSACATPLVWCRHESYLKRMSVAHFLFLQSLLIKCDIIQACALAISLQAAEEAKRCLKGTGIQIKWRARRDYYIWQLQFPPNDRDKMTTREERCHIPTPWHPGKLEKLLLDVAAQRTDEADKLALTRAADVMLRCRESLEKSSEVDPAAVALSEDSV